MKFTIVINKVNIVRFFRFLGACILCYILIMIYFTFDFGAGYFSFIRFLGVQEGFLFSHTARRIFTFCFFVAIFSIPFFVISETISIIVNKTLKSFNLYCIVLACVFLLMWLRIAFVSSTTYFIAIADAIEGFVTISSSCGASIAIRYCMGKMRLHSPAM